MLEDSIKSICIKEKQANMSHGNLAIEEGAFFYSLNKHKTAIFEQKFELDKKIDKEKLRSALKETIKYFDRFRLKAVINKDGKVELMENGAELPIYDDENQIFAVGTKDTNGYLYAVCVKDFSMRLVIFHALCDGRGAGYFTNVLLLNYLKYEYGEACIDTEIKKYVLDDLKHKLNLDDVLHPYAEKNLSEEIAKPFTLPNPKDIFIVDKEVNYFYKNSFFTTVIEWDVEALLNIVHKYDMTPFVFFFMLISDAMIEVYDVKNEYIVSNVAVDLRKYLCSNSFYNFGTSINVDFKTEWHSLPIEEKARYLKESFATSLNYDGMIADIYKASEMMKKVSDFQNVEWLKKNRDDNYGKINPPLFSCFISNVGKAVYPDVIAKHVKNPSTYSTPINLVPDYTIFSYEKTGILTQNQNFQNEAIMKKIYEKLEGFGIASKYIEEKEIEISHFDTLMLDRL